MNQYEITYISNPNLDEGQRAQLDGAIDSKISELSGTSNHATTSLRRRLAYAINKNSSGFLRYIHLDLAPEHIATIKELLHKDSNILRYSILATARRQEVPAEITAKYVTKKTDANKKKMGGNKAGVRTHTKPAGPVSDEAVAKGIEEALSEEVK
ncbi:MAG: 30S ribosomal protein S6 [Candidatus Andersenbacteria bacterium]|nr:30S ribosomal protein S6 [Candidatus Andersenbacteria bacterium]